jgi:CspA family cold shock protein|tara:strand:- start:134 stop:325 length:192 start_codon:yes stop_codon:yes gene_type:complete
MKQGMVKFFDDTKGFGFITEEGSGEDYFVHSTGLSRRIKEGDKVEFELKEGQRGMQAHNVKPV